jgi:hypothetical protein
VRVGAASITSLSLSVLSVGIAGCATATESTAPVPLTGPFVAQSQPSSQGGSLSFDIRAGRDAQLQHIDLAFVSRPVRLEASDTGVGLDTLAVSLGDLKVGTSLLPPDGFTLREVVASLSARTSLQVVRRDPDTLVSEGAIELVLDWTLLLGDGTRWPLGHPRFQGVRVELSIASRPDGRWLSVDAACDGLCWELPGVVAIGDLALHFDAPTQVVTPDQAGELPAAGAVVMNEHASTHMVRLRPH